MTGISRAADHSGVFGFFRSLLGERLLAFFSALAMVFALTPGGIVNPAHASAEEIPAPTLWTTDAAGTPKLDFAPNETVYVHGSDFSADTTYAIPVTRPNGSVVLGDGSFLPGWDSTTTDSSGALYYEYILNGVEGPYVIDTYLDPWAGPDSTDPLVASFTFTDSTGDFSIDFTAAAPNTYNHLTGGGAYNDRTVGINDDIVESLEGGDFVCGDIVTYLVAVTVDDTQSADDDAPQTIEMDFSFLADTTGQSGVALGEVTTVAVNYGAVSNGAGPGGTDAGILFDDGGSTASIVSTGLTGPLFQSGSELLLTVELDDLERKEQVIVRIDVKLFCDPGSNPTGNLQGALSAAWLTFINDDSAIDPPAAIPGGAQTIPFKQIGNIGAPQIELAKTVTSETGTCPGVELLTPVSDGDTVKYCYVVSNPGDAPLYNVALGDDNGTPGAPGDDFPVTLIGLTDEDGDGTNDDLAAGATATGEALVVVTATTAGIVTNTGTATGDDSVIQPTTLTDTDTASIEIVEGPPSILVTKTADPTTVPEPGAPVTFTITVENTSGPTDPVTITSLSDDVHGDLNGQGDCSVPQTIQPGDTYTCSFTATVSGVPGDSETDVVTASGTDDEGTPVSDDDDAVVTINDVPSAIEVLKTATPTSVDEPGGSVTYSFVVNNLSTVDSVTIDTLDDTIYGDLNGQGDCSVPQTIVAGGSYSCSITVNVSGNAGDVITNVVTASGLDDDGIPVSDDDDAVVTINDVPSAIEVLKTATPTSVDEPGGSVTYSFVVNNLSTVDSVTIDTLDDTIYGDLNGQGDCSVPQTIVAGGSYSCSITVNVSGNAGDVITNVVTASGLDDDGIPVSDDDDAVVTINDVPSAIEVLKTATPTSVDEPGGSVTYSFVVNNLSTVDSVTIDTLDDTIYGDLNGQGDCSVPQTIVAGGSYSCSITVNVSGNAGDVITNVVTASGLDDDGIPVSDDDDAVVTINDVPSAIEVLKTATPTSVDEPGGSVTYSFVVNNLSTVDSVTIDTLDDTIYGDLNGQGDCSVPQTIVAGGSYSCSITVNVSGNAGDVITNVVTASGLDDDGIPVSDDDDAVVTINDVPSAIEVLKTAGNAADGDVFYIDEPGGLVGFSITITNTSLVDTVTIDSIVDSIYGNLIGATDSDCVAVTLVPGESTSCTFDRVVSGNAGDVETNVVTASGLDDDGVPVSDDATLW